MIFESRFRCARRAFPLLFFIILLLVFSVYAFARRGRSRALADRAQTLIPAEPQGADRCSFCHPAEVKGYARSAMAHSLRRAGEEADGEVSANGSKIITMHSSASGFWQRWENGGDQTDYRVDFVIGSGKHASGYLVDLGGHLFQSPVAYYISRRAYDLAPGYENQPDPDFTRPVSEECVLCHSGTALHVPGTLNQYRSPIFSVEAISCERCHGPSERHLADPRAGTIVNPAKLDRVARDSICEQCHLFGVARVPNPGKELADFTPGQRLEDTYTTYRDAAPSGAFKVISQVEQLALSVCARQSGGRLWCGTCHNPHDEPLEPVKFYRSRCLSCHEANFPASHPSKQSDCVSCHMPRRPAKDGGHTAFTDHRIQRRPESEPDVSGDTSLVAWREPPGDLKGRNLGIAYVEVGIERHSPPFIVRGYRNLTEVQEQFPNDSELFRWIGEALLAGGQTSEAKIALERALALNLDSAGAEARAAGPYIQQGDAEGAIAHLEHAVSLDPLDLVTDDTLIALYRKQGKAAAIAALSDEIKAAMGTTPSRDQTAQQGRSRGSDKKAEEVFRNIQVLKGIPSSQFIPAMRFISSSLGVPCDFCHVEGHFEADTKKPKQIAREMIEMTFTLNKNDFAGHREITCYSCHRGAVNPVGTPIVASETLPQLDVNSEAPETDASLPPASQVIDHYIQAMGGAAAIEKITSRVETGIAQLHGRSVGFEIWTQVPGKRVVVRHLPDGDSITTFDGHAGWLSIPGRPTEEMKDAELVASRLDADLHLPLDLWQLFPDLHVEYSEKISGRETYVIFGTPEGQPSVKLYFDTQTGLLVRLVRYADSPLGFDPTQIDYADYRPVGGVEVPLRVTLSEPQNVAVLEIEQVQQNVAIDDQRFAQPAPDRQRPGR
jgi:photosynthetic reaction center cytochrome c subunit